MSKTGKRSQEYIGKTDEADSFLTEMMSKIMSSQWSVYLTDIFVCISSGTFLSICMGHLGL